MDEKCNSFRITGFHMMLMLVGLIMGFMIVVQFRTSVSARQIPPVQQAYNLVSQIEEARNEQEGLRKRLGELRADLDNLAAGPRLEELKSELQRARIGAGLVEVTGPGVVITLNDSPAAINPGENPNLYVLHDEDVIKILNEIKAAGAEAISINGQRMLATSEIRCVGPTILTNKNQRLTPPFVITAIGNPDNMINSLQMRGGVIEQLQFWGIQTTVRRDSEVTVPAYAGGIRFQYARSDPKKKAGGS